MVIKKDLVIAVLSTFCLTATLFMIMPTRSSSAERQYDPWSDYNDDGKIDIKDLVNTISLFETYGDPTKNVNVTNWPIWLVNQSAPLVKEMPLCRLYHFNITSTSFTTAINATPPIGKTWYVSEIRLMPSVMGGDGQATLKTKGVIQFSDMKIGLINTYFDSVKFPASIKFTDTESIIVEAKVSDGYPYVYGLLLVIGWEE